jgi:hypothetical protein
MNITVQKQTKLEQVQDELNKAIHLVRIQKSASKRVTKWLRIAVINGYTWYQLGLWRNKSVAISYIGQLESQYRAISKDAEAITELLNDISWTKTYQRQKDRHRNKYDWRNIWKKEIERLACRCIGEGSFPGHVAIVLTERAIEKYDPTYGKLS